MPVRFPDIQNHWAQAFIEALTDRGVISGFPDGTFQPDRPIDRAQFAALIAKAFNLPAVRDPIDFSDVPANYWAYGAIRRTYVMGFMSGYPRGRFGPNDNLRRVDALVSLTSGLKLAAGEIAVGDLPSYYNDAAQVPDYGRLPVAIATERELVVNHPNPRLLRPVQPATRADVSAFLYQALRQTDGLPAIDSPYIVKPDAPPPPTVTVSHQREFRGAWIAAVWNINWPSRQDLSTAQQQAELVAILDRLQSVRMNAVILQVRPEGDALYASNLEPWSRWLTGQQGRAPSPYYDPLEFAIAEAHKRNLELHAWFNPYRARSSTNAPPGVAPHVEAVYPRAVYTYGTQRWMDPGVREIQNRTFEVILDVVRRYDIDGIHLDDYFYPYPVSGQEFPDLQTYYERGDGRTRNDWRRFNVNSMVSRLYKGIRDVKPHVKFGISPFGIYRPGEPPGIRGLDQYDALFADPKRWLAEGWVDYLAPQLYWRIDPPAQSYSTLLDWWTSVNVRGTPIYAGNNLVKLGETSDWSFTEFERQVAISRSLFSRKSWGNIFYNTDPLLDNRQGAADRFRDTLYPGPALPPVLNATGNLPNPPVGARGGDRRIDWDATTDPNVRGWSLYRQTGDRWILGGILPRSATSAGVMGGTYALCAVDRSARESPGVVIRA